MSHNVETHLRRQIAKNYRGNIVMRTLAKYDAFRAGFIERDLCEKCDIVSVETQEDAVSFSQLFAPHEILMASPGYAGAILDERTIDDAVPNQVCVLGGRLSTMKQIVLDELLESSAQAITELGVELHAIGPMAPDYMAGVSARYPQVAVHGFVSDIAPLMQKMRAGIVADHVGGGFKHRILSYVFHRVPMIALPEAMAGLPFTSGVHYHPVSSYEDVAEAVQRLISDDILLNYYQTNAFNACIQLFSWQKTMARFAEYLVERSPSNVR